MSLDLWLTEMRCRHEWDIRTSGGKWHKESFKPDGFVRLEASSVYFNFFIEADLGHTSSRQFEGKILTHTRYLESGLFEQTFGSSRFRTLVITKGERRLKNLAQIVADRNSDLFWFTTFDQLHTGGVLAPIWSVPGHSQLETLV